MYSDCHLFYTFLSCLMLQGFCFEKFISMKKIFWLVVLLITNNSGLIPVLFMQHSGKQPYKQLTYSNFILKSL